MIEKTLNYVRNCGRNDYSGHDFEHAQRVYKMAMQLAKEEGADLQIVALASLLHDVDDRKISPSTYLEKSNAKSFLMTLELDDITIEKILLIIKEVEFLGIDSLKPSTIEGMCVQDADRLDALGAIGIARAFAYGGSHNRKMYDYNVPPKLNMTREEYVNHKDGNTINHFYEKLLTLKDLMNTESGKIEAERRTSFMLNYLAEFSKETL